MSSFQQRPWLTYAGAARLVAAAVARAEEMGLKVCISVLDPGGDLLAYGRMDGAVGGASDFSRAKATTAAARRAPSRDVPAEKGHLLATVSGGKIVPLPGGLPIMVDGQLAGAIGVGGAHPDQDEAIAKAALEGLA